MGSIIMFDILLLYLVNIKTAHITAGDLWVYNNMPGVLLRPWQCLLQCFTFFWQVRSVKKKRYLTVVVSFSVSSAAPECRRS